MQELRDLKTDDVKYSVFIKDDGKSFVHTAVFITEKGKDIIPNLEAFKKFREDLKQFQHQPVDDEFAGRFETLMRDFVIQHQYYGDIEQWDVTCKSYQCEMRVVSVEVDNKSWQRIFNDMKLESWFQFTGYTTAPIPNEEYKTIGAILFLQGIPNV